MKKTILILMSLVIVFITCIRAEAEEIPLDSELLIYAWELEEEYNISAPLLLSLVYQESRGRVDAKNGSHKGLTQINPRYFKETIELLEVTDLFNPYENMKVCAYTLSYWYEKYGDGDVYLILEMWNEGEQNAYRTHNPDKPSRYAQEISDRAIEWTYEWEKFRAIKK